MQLEHSHVAKRHTWYRAVLCTTLYMLNWTALIRRDIRWYGEGFN